MTPKINKKDVLAILTNKAYVKHILILKFKIEFS